jgi:hypothetical protein
MVDEKQAVKVGRTGREPDVMGRYSTLGKTAVLQAKRVDVASQKPGRGSLKCSQGRRTNSWPR